MMLVTIDGALCVARQLTDFRWNIAEMNFRRRAICQLLSQRGKQDYRVLTESLWQGGHDFWH